MYSCCNCGSCKLTGLWLLGDPLKIIAKVTIVIKPEFEQVYPLNLSILLSGGKETN